MRVWLTADGRHVLDGDPDAAVLAYGEDDLLPKAVQDELDVHAKAEAKAAEPSAAKQRKPSANK